MLKYEKRTPESVKAELESYTEKDCLQLAKFLQNFMANEHNGKDFLSILKLTGLKPHEKMRSMIASAHDWFAYGN